MKEGRNALAFRDVTRVLIVEDHKVVAEGLSRLLADRFAVIDAIHDGTQVLEAVRHSQPDLILLDISLPGISGLEVIHQLKHAGLSTRIIVLTMHAEGHLAVEALSSGAAGFVLKDSGGDELLHAIDMVLSGRTYFPQDLTKEIVTLMVGATDPNQIELTAQQREVLRLVVRGQRAKEIASAMDISTRSVESIKYKTMQLLNVHSTAELVRYAVEHKLVPL